MKKKIVIEVENELQETWLQQMFEREIAKEYGVDRSTIRSVVSNETWRKCDD